MVRLNKPTEFQFPFQSSETTSAIQISRLSQIDFADKVLSIFVGTFFFATLLAITLDNSTAANNLNYLASQFEPTMENIIPLTSLEKEEMEIQPNKKTPILKNKILALAPSTLKNLSKKKVNIPNLNQSSPKEFSTVEKKEFSNSIEFSQNEAIYLNQPRISKIDREKIIESSIKTIKVSPKPVFVDYEIATQDLVVNEKITLDLLPLSYFHAKKKAADEGKLTVIKFGAEWCLPCRQMENTTFKDEGVKGFLEKNYVSLSVDIDDFDGVNMKSYFNVKLLPTLIIFNSKGDFVAKYINFQSADSMLEILEKHQLENRNTPTIALKEAVKSPEFTFPKMKKTVSVDFNKVVLSKKRNGNAINFLKSKAKNWRYTQLEFSTKNFNEGELLLQVKETVTGFNLTELNIPVIKNQGIADTTTTNFQLVLEHEKHKEKNGEYVVEIYHITQNDLTLVGKTTLLKDGEIHF